MPELHALIGKTGAAIVIIATTIVAAAAAISAAVAVCSAMGALLGRLL